MSLIGQNKPVEKKSNTCRQCGKKIDDSYIICLDCHTRKRFGLEEKNVK